MPNFYMPTEYQATPKKVLLSSPPQQPMFSVAKAVGGKHAIKAMRKRITSQQLADYLGLARSTVSMALSDSPKIKKQTKELVQRAARELDYIPNVIARAMPTGKTRVLGFITQLTTPEIKFRLLMGVMNAATEAGYHIKLIPTEWKMDSAEIARICIGECLGGVLVTQVWDETIGELVESLHARSIPVATMLSGFSHRKVANALSDDSVGIHEAIEHLVGLGHRKIAYLGGDPQVASERARRDAFLHAVKIHKLALPSRFLVEKSFIADEAKVAFRTMLESGPPPSAVLCGNDQIAMVAIRTARSMGVNVPTDISVVGFSNTEMAKWCDPPLASINQGFEEVGKMATQAVLRALAKNRISTSVRKSVPSHFIARASTAPAHK
ncbi:LacI family DNA-binding transcriptional regulator [Ruficoccus sp. ZRK36]|uniref:LacI family DNA-binding transcriptional regulator n=1 Tax=Ruficoccus sp. ZRK36 TaxID=2866311 RepID=UPI001C72C2F0|nr:LacI family DNA-binding transcriptional regulator [Ruficoccus sp. ZRK36]QYY37259.1 LacI family transcriptional regulator [Ruficoccus sp. ZRK36]